MRRSFLQGSVKAQVHSWCAIVVSAAMVVSSATAGEHGAGEAIVEARLLAPCCYLQTLDVHESPLASELRLEIRARLAAGESAEAIEDDFASRYGQRVRAFAKGKDPRTGMPLFVLVFLGACAVGLGFVIRRWRRRSARTLARRAATKTARDALDARIDDDLASLDG